MIAMASITDEYMTVQQVMDAINARAPSTVTRLIRTAENSAGPLTGEKIPGHGWLIRRKSVERFLEEEQARSPGVGFPRGHVRSPQKAAPRRASKSARPARRAGRG